MIIIGKQQMFREIQNNKMNENIIYYTYKSSILYYTSVIYLRIKLVLTIKVKTKGYTIQISNV